jgi:hypothetical protein
MDNYFVNAAEESKE